MKYDTPKVRPTSDSSYWYQFDARNPKYGIGIKQDRYRQERKIAPEWTKMVVLFSWKLKKDLFYDFFENILHQLGKYEIH